MSKAPRVIQKILAVQTFNRFEYGVFAVSDLINIEDATAAGGTQAAPEKQHRALDARKNCTVALVIIRRHDVANYFIELNLSFLKHEALYSQKARKYRQ